MARAALLNLKGNQCQAAGQSPVDVNMNMGGFTNPNIGLAIEQVAFGQLGGQVPSAAASPLPVQDRLLRAALGNQELSALGVNVPQLDSLNARASQIPAQGLRIPASQQLPANASGPLDDSSAELQLALMGMQGLRTRAQNGYTPVEQLILQAHVRQQRADGLSARAEGLPSTFGLGSHSIGRETSRRLLDSLPQMSEDDFHATAGLQRVLAQTLHDSSSRVTDEHVSSLARDLEQRIISSQQTRQRNHTLAGQARSDADTQALHVRASTLPSQYLGARSHPTSTTIPIYDSNVSLGTVSNSTNSLRNTNIHVTSTKQRPSIPISHPTTSRRTPTSNINASPLPDTQTLFSSKNNINIPSAASRISMKSTPHSNTTIPVPSSAPTRMRRTNSGAALTATSLGRAAASNAQDADDEDDQSSVVSPALTYSTRTPASLSPATPYSGFFADGAETFKTHGVGVVGVTELPRGLETNVGDKERSSTSQ